MNPATPAAFEPAAIGDIVLQSILNENQNTVEAMRSVRPNGCCRADDYTEAIKPTLDHVQRELLDEISALPTEHNRMIPLHQLPVEIFVQIITLALEPFRTRLPSRQTYLGRLTHLCQVCKQWRDAIEGTASLWASIDILDPLAITSVALCRSANHPLNIIGASYGPIKHTYRPLDGLDEFAKIAIMLSTRWNSIQLIVPSSEKAQAIMSAPAPVLQSLEVKSTVQYRLHIPEGTMFQGTTPQLRRLGLHGIAIPWDSYILRKLQYLSISGLDEFSPSYQETLGILKACPSLGELDLWLERGPAVETSKKETPFRLAELNYMSLFLSPSWTLALLETIQQPLVRSLSLTLDLNPNTESSHLLRPIIKSAYALFPTIFDAQYKIVITIFSADCLHWTCEPSGTNRGGRSFEITERDKSASETLKDILDETPSNRFTPESIKIDFNSSFDLDLSSFLPTLDGVDRIYDIVASGPCACDLDPLFKYMSRATTCDQYGFPKLENLKISDDNYDPSHLLSMIKARYGLEVGVGSDTPKGQRDLPPPLKWVSINNVPATPGIFQLIEELIGSECFELRVDVE